MPKASEFKPGGMGLKSSTQAIEMFRLISEQIEGKGIEQLLSAISTQNVSY